MKVKSVTVSELSEMIQNGKISAKDLVNEFYSEESGNFFSDYLDKNTAIKNVENIYYKIENGEKLSKFAAIPYAVQDNICTTKFMTQCGSKMLENYISPFDASIIKYADECGMLLLGKLDMNEFGVGKNDKGDFISNAVKNGDVMFAYATDCAGETAQCAAKAGLVGLKTSYGSVSRNGVISWSSSLDSVSVISRSTDDAVAAFEVVAKKDTADVMSADISWDFSFENFDLKGMKIGILSEGKSLLNNDDMLSEFSEVVKIFEKYGVKTAETDFPILEYAAEAHLIISSAEASCNLAKFDGIRFGHQAKNFDGIDELYTKSRSEGFGDEVKKRILLGNFVLSEGNNEKYYNHAMKVRSEIRAKYSQLFEKYDAILVPTVDKKTSEDFAKVQNQKMIYASVSLAGLPSLTLPSYGENLGSITLIGGAFSETKLLRIGKCHEEILKGVKG